jgi:purine-nucleoside phosphorylase
MPSFFSPEPTARIEPTEFVAHFLAYRGLDATALGLRRTVVLSFIPALERRLLRALGTPPPQPQAIQRQTWYNPASAAFSVMTSPMGAPMAAMLLEQLIALGARRFLYLGFCGAVDATYAIGDLFMPTTAMREEGTSYHYLPAAAVPGAAAHLNATLQDQADRQGLRLRSGPIWTTDAPYRETAQKIQHFQDAGAHAVDMEMAALLAVAQYRTCDVCALLVISDECYHDVWKPGFGATPLRRGCRDAVALALTTAARLAVLTPADLSR